MEMAPESNGVAAGMPRPKTRYGRAKLLTLSDLDRRTAAVQEAFRRLDGMEVALGGDLTAQEHELAERSVFLGAIARDLEARWLAGEQISLADYFQACTVQRRVLCALGLQRRPKQVEGVEEYLARQRVNQENSNAPAASE